MDEKNTESEENKDFNFDVLRENFNKKLHNTLDAINSLLKSIKERICSTFKDAIKNSEQSQEENSSEPTEIKKEEKQKSKNNSILRLFVASLLDIMASLVFIAAIVIAIKPGILAGRINAPSASYHVVFEKIGNTLMKIESTPVNRPSASQAFFVGLGLVIYGALKILVLLSVKNGTRKTVSILTLIITYFACFMMADKFLLFAIFILLLYASFEYSCEFPTALIFSKLAFVIVTAIAIYISVHLALDPNLAREVLDVMKKLSLPIKRWW